MEERRGAVMPRARQGTSLIDANAVIEWAFLQIEEHYRLLNMHVFWFTEPTSDRPFGEQLHAARDSSPLAEELRLLVRVANGAIDRPSASEVLVGEVVGAIQAVVELMCLAPANGASYIIPPAFWETPLGQVVALAQAWVSGADLIGLTEAAGLAYPGLTPAAGLARIIRHIERGDLRSFPDPHATNPQHARRVSRRAVEALGE